MLNKFGFILIVISFASLSCYAHTVSITNQVDGAGVTAFGAEDGNSIDIKEKDTKQLTFDKLPLTVAYDDSSQPSPFFSVYAKTSYWCPSWSGDGTVIVTGKCDKNWLGFCTDNSTIQLSCQ